MQSRKRKIFISFFVRRPIGFVIFLVLGITVFISIAGRIRVPVYTTVKTRVEKEGNDIKLDLKDTHFQKDTPVFLYHARDEYLEKVTGYRLDGGYIVLDSMDGIRAGEKINVDLQIREVSLLRHIFADGGNT